MKKLLIIVMLLTLGVFAQGTCQPGPYDPPPPTSGGAGLQY